MRRGTVQSLVGLMLSLAAWPWPAAGQVVINEVLVKNTTTLRNAVGFETYVELFNTTASAVSLAGWSLTDNTNSPAKFVFPPDTIIPPQGLLLVWCDNELVAGELHTGFQLKGATDDLALFNGPLRVDYVAFGIQATDLALSRLPDGAGPWQLASPTPGFGNTARPPLALGSPLALRINEWMAADSREDDWLEIYNPAANGPVNLSGLVIIDSTNAAQVSTARAIPGLSFIRPGGFVRFWADDLASKDANHLGFKLAKSGDAIALFGIGGALIDQVAFGPQTTDVSMGRLPDGSANIFNFPAGSSTPEFSNLLPLTNVVVNELLAHTDPPLEDAVEFYNPTAVPVDLSHYWLSNDQSNPKKYRIPVNTIIPPFGFKVFYEYTSWNRNRTGTFPEFTFSAERSGQVVLCSGNSAGNLTGYGLIQDFGPSANGVSFGRHLRSDGRAELVPMSDLSFGTAIRAGSPPTPQNQAIFESGLGAANPPPLVGPVVISEIMYHPPATLVGTNWEENISEEYIELYNCSSNAVPLFDPAYPFNTWRLREAVDFDFAPGTVIPPLGHLAVVSFDPAGEPEALQAFCRTYRIPTNSLIVGPYQGKLANNIENIVLRRPDAPNVSDVPYLVVERVEYGASDPWPKSADGGGRSLHRLNPGGYANDPANWTAAAPTPLKTRSGLRFNELLPGAQPPTEAFIEIANPTAAPVDISHWWLSDDQGAPEKFRFPTNTVIPAFGLVVVRAAQFNPAGNGLAPGFALDPVHGGEVVLAAAQASGELTGEWLAERYGPAEAGIALGWQVTSDHYGEFAPLSAPTPGAPNAALAAGPVIISEIMFHPPDFLSYVGSVPVHTDNSDDEYVELRNLSAKPVPLYSTATNAPRQFTNTWRLRNEVAFDFPSFVSLPPTGRLLVVNFDPTANPAQLIQFRAKYNVPAHVPLFGPLVGRFNNRSGALELQKPGPVQTPPAADAGLVQYYLVEKVRYADQAPWPANTDGQGSSLQRIAATAYADDPASWFGALPTTGRAEQPEAHLVQSPPANLLVAPGSNVTLTATAEGAPPIACQWWFNGLPLDQATNGILTLSNALPAREGTYQLWVSNAFGMDTSAPVQLTLAVNPGFQEYPASQFLRLGDRLVLSATVTGTPPFAFRWWRGVPLPSLPLATHAGMDLNTDSFELPKVLLADAGWYYVTVTNLANPAGRNSPFARLAVIQPLGERMAMVGSNLTLDVKVAAYGTLHYQWRCNQTNLPGATNSSLTLTNLQADQSGDYELLLSFLSAFTGAVGVVSCRVTVQTDPTPPEILQQPASLRVTNGARALLQAAARGTDPLRCQWWFNQTNLVTLGTNNFLEFTNVTAEALGAYQWVVSNAVGMATSQVARLVAVDDRSAAPLLSPLAAAGQDAVIFSFTTAPGFSYQVQSKRLLTDSEWQALGPPWVGDGLPKIIQAPMNTSGQQFYRVLLLP